MKAVMPLLGTLPQIESSGRQGGDALDVTLRGKASRYFTVLAYNPHPITLPM